MTKLIVAAFRKIKYVGFFIRISPGFLFSPGQIAGLQTPYNGIALSNVTGIREIFWAFPQWPLETEARLRLREFIASGGNGNEYEIAALKLALWPDRAVSKHLFAIATEYPMTLLVIGYLLYARGSAGPCSDSNRTGCGQVDRSPDLSAQARDRSAAPRRIPCAPPPSGPGRSQDSPGSPGHVPGGAWPMQPHPPDALLREPLTFVGRRTGLGNRPLGK